MRVIIVSDTHGMETNLERVLERERERNLLIHLGDVEGAEDYIRVIAECPCEIIAGNNDYGWTLPMESSLNLCGKKVLLTHGSSYRVSLGNDYLLQAAAEKNSDIVMFGHTHRPLVERYYLTLEGKFISEGALISEDRFAPADALASEVSSAPEDALVSEAGSASEDALIDAYKQPVREITLVNPGSLTYPRQKGRQPSYIVLEIDENNGNRFRYEIRYLEQ